MPKLTLRIFQTIFILFGAWWLQGYESIPALTWMNIYGLEDFSDASWQQIWSFIWTTRLPIPPLVLTAELISFKALGSANIVINVFYKTAFILPYVIAIEIACSNRVRFIAVYLLACLFLFCAVRIHHGNPQGYDVYLPCFFLLFVYFFKLSLSSESGWRQKIFTFGAGVFLSMTELTRPFIVYALPLITFFVFSRYWLTKPDSAKLAVIFLIPIILVSGSFHALLWKNHQQLTFSNNAGFNLSRAWGRLIVVPELLDESKAGVIKEGRWLNLDTDEHQINSERFKQAVLNQWIAQPIQSAAFAISLLNDFLIGETSIYEHQPNSIFIQTYKLIYKLLASLILINLTIIALAFCAHPKGIIKKITTTDNIVILTTGFLILVFAIGEKGEEARFIISVLPMLCLLPLARVNDYPLDSGTQKNRSQEISFNW